MRAETFHRVRKDIRTRELRLRGLLPTRSLEEDRWVTAWLVSHYHLDRASYYRYLQSLEWAVLTAEVRERSGGWCERHHGPWDRRPAVAVHHLTYVRQGCEWLSDLLHVCRECHQYLDLWARSNVWFVIPPDPCGQTPAEEWEMERDALLRREIEWDHAFEDEGAA